MRSSFTATSNFPASGSAEEILRFKSLQAGFSKQFQEVFPDMHANKTIVIVPSLTMDQEILQKINGHVFYEERLLCLLMLLRMPRTKVIYVTSVPVDPVTVDYYLHLLPGISGFHARQRLTMLSCYDASASSLTEKLLQRPRLLQRIRNLVTEKDKAHLICFNTTAAERSLAVQLDMPLFGCDPDLLNWGSKSGSRKIFRAIDIPLPDGVEDIYTRHDLISALVSLKIKYPAAKKVVVKLNDGFSGDGNALFYYPANDDHKNLHTQIADNLLINLRCIAKDISAIFFIEKLEQMGGIVEVFVDGEEKTSPSVQCRIEPTGTIKVLSTHDQLLGGADSQVYLGAYFPADAAYQNEIAAMGEVIGKALAAKGVLGRFGVDFISVKQGDKWLHYAIEINLRKGGTTHPLLMLEFLTDGEYKVNEAAYITATGNKRYYFTSDNLCKDTYKGLTPQDLIDIIMYHGLLYDGTTQEGVTFHLMGATSQFGKLGVVCIGSTPQRAYTFYEKVTTVLELECGE